MYENGMETRAKIVSIAKELFWKHGYESTGYRDISAANGSSPGLVHYHFNKKPLLGYAVYLDIVNDIEAAVSDVVPENDDLFRSVVISTIIWRLVSCSEEFSRFMYDVSVNRISVVDDADADIYRYREIMSAYGRESSENEFLIRLHMAFAGERELFIDYASGDYGLDASECAALDSEMSLQLMGVPDDTIRQLIDRASELVSKLTLKVGENFSICITR